MNDDSDVGGHGSGLGLVPEVKTTSGLLTTPQGTAAVGMVVVVLVGEDVELVVEALPG